VKANDNERLPTSTTEIEGNDHMMICEDSNSKVVETMDKSPAVVIPKHCNGICKYVIENRNRENILICLYLVLMLAQQHLSYDAIAIHIDFMVWCHTIRISTE
jgi:hypothetical protein